MKLNPNAQTINDMIKEGNPRVFEMLSEKGEHIYYPLTGLLEQAKQAKGKKHNATIGMLVNDNGEIAHVPSISRLVTLPPDEVFRYGPSYGEARFRKKWNQEIYNKNPSLEGQSISPTVVTVALTHAISSVFNMFVGPNDKVIIPKPLWGNYLLSITIAEHRAEHVSFPLFSHGKYNLNGLEQCLMDASSEKKIVLFNFPQNPTGYTPTLDEANNIKDIVYRAANTGKKIVAICDDAYFGFFFEKDILHESIFAYLANLHENVLAVKVDGATKEHGVYGLRVGGITYGNSANDSKKLYEGLEHKTAGAVRGTVSNAPLISQALLLAAMESEDFVPQNNSNRTLLEKRYKKVKDTLEEHPEYKQFLSPLPFNSGFFMCFKVIEGFDAENVRSHTLNKYDTGFISLPDNLIRMAYSGLSSKSIPTAMDNLYKGCIDLVKCVK